MNGTATRVLIAETQEKSGQSLYCITKGELSGGNKFATVATLNGSHRERLMRGHLMSDLLKLSKPFNPRFIEQKGGSFSADYVSHSTVNEFLLGILGPFDWQLVQVLHEPDGMVSGAVYRLSVEIDGRMVHVEEVGSIQQGGTKNNGDRMKDAASDCLKRCAMRMGLGLHLWSQENYILHTTLESKTPQKEETEDGPSV